LTWGRIPESSTLETGLPVSSIVAPVESLASLLEAEVVSAFPSAGLDLPCIVARFDSVLVTTKDRKAHDFARAE
jgi:hypothetical protein